MSIPGFFESLAASTMKDAVKKYVEECSTAALHDGESSWLPEFLKKRYRKKVVVAGVAGSGKSILIDRLTGRVNDLYQPPDNTINIENRKGNLGKLVYQVIDTRGNRTIKDLNEEPKVRGVIWVLSNGLVETDTVSIHELEDIAKQSRDYEIAKLKEGLAFIRENREKYKKIWMLVAFTKYDLYQCYLKGIKSQISAYEEFRNRANEVQKVLIGTRNAMGHDFAFDILPFVGFSSDFRIGQGELQSEIDSKLERELCKVAHQTIRRLESM